MSEVPLIIAEVTAADWVAAGPGWTHLPYLARFRADGLPLSWEGFFTDRHPHGWIYRNDAQPNRADLHGR